MRKLRCKVLLLASDHSPNKEDYPAGYWEDRVAKIAAKKKERWIEKERTRNKQIENSRRGFWFGKGEDIHQLDSNEKNTILPKISKKHLIDRLCHKLSDREIDLINDCPGFYFQKNGKLIDSRFVDQHVWDIKAGIA